MHVEVDSGVVAREVDVVISKNLLLYRNGVEQELQVRMALDVFDVAHVESPGYLPRKLVMGQVELLNGRVEGEDDVFFEGLGGRVID